jgi:hypothetical protein
MNVPTVDIKGKPFTGKDMKLLELLLQPNGASLDRINRVVATGVPARSYINDTARLARRCGGIPWNMGTGGDRRFGIRRLATT